MHSAKDFICAPTFSVSVSLYQVLVQLASIRDPQTVSQVSAGITVPLLPHLVLAFTLNTFSEINYLVGLK